MDEMEQAQRELDRLADIITRHEAHMFALRGWLLVVLGGLLAAYYTANIHISEILMKVALPIVVVLFLVLESRHTNLVEAVVARSSELENRIRCTLQTPGEKTVGWYDGPKVSQACEDGAKRLWPYAGMTWVFYWPFYVIVFLITLCVALSLPDKG
jgi:hypothetical protein